MHKFFPVILSLTLWATPAGISAVVPQTVRIDKQCPVHKIYVAEFGTDPRHINFRLFLEKWLAKRKFTVATKAGDAEAVLSGSLSISSGRKYSYLAFKDAELKTPNGEKPWSGDFDFKTKNAFGWLGRGHIENGAKLIAENIRGSCK